MKKIKYLFTFLVTIFLFIDVAGAEEINYSNSEYIINNYHIDIKVNEDNSFDITENIGAHFYVNKHGIYRKIPITNKIEREDGTTSNNRVKISNVNVNNTYVTSREDGNFVIKIGNANSTVTGSQKYNISYNYNIGKDKLKNNDEFYFNLIGTEWDTSIQNVTFKITMPKEFDETLLGFTVGSYGSVDTEGVNYTVNGNVITGSYSGTLLSGEGLTVRLTLEDGYFSEAVSNFMFIEKMMFIIPLICVIISFLIWFKHGRDEKPIETVEFYPPENLNSLELGFVYKGEVENKDVISLLIYLANKGYISIEKPKNEGLLSFGNNFKIVKQKEYDGNNDAERMFLNGLFMKKSIFSSSSAFEVNELELRNSFYSTIDRILLKTNNKENKWKIFTKNSLKKKTLILLMILLTIITIVFVPTFSYGSIEMLPMTLFLTFFYSIFYYVIFVKSKLSFGTIFAGIFIIFHSLVFFSSMPVGMAIANDSFYLYAAIFGIICVIIMVIFLKIVPKRNEYGSKLLGRVEGFKNFLETAEKTQLETQVLNNPKYFYDILPYTYVLGVSDKWIEKFESIAIIEPDWYHGTSTFSVHNFGSFMNSTMRSAQSSMSSRPSSSSSGGSSGGGRSGGGSGGGGGGSW